METRITNCPDCGTSLTEIQLFGSDPITGKRRRMLVCPKCDWRSYL